MFEMLNVIIIAIFALAAFGILKLFKHSPINYLKKWYKTYTYVTKNHFYNPVKQSLGHVNAIKKTLKDLPDLMVVPIVVFAGNANLNHVSSQYHVVYSDQLLATNQSYNCQCLSETDLNCVVNCLVQRNVRKQVGNRKHVNNFYAVKQKVIIR